MVLDHVADGARLIVKSPAALYSEVLRHRDLDALDVVAVPKSLDKSVGKAKRQHVVDCSLAKIMANAEDRSFLEGPKQDLVQFLRRCEVMADRLFHDDSRSPPAVRSGQVLDDGFEQHRRNCQIMRRSLRILELLPKRSEGCRILVIAVDIAQHADQLLESGGIEPPMFLQTVFRASAKLIEVPSSFGDPNHGDVEVSSFHHRLQGRENLLVGKIAGGAEKNECV